jgi:REP element-mobilizing transposase RayT
MPRLPDLSPVERRIVRDEALRWHRRAWRLHVVSAMPDHVHIIATPLEAVPGEWYSLPQIMRRVKGRSSYEINKLRGRRGHLWQDESYDRIIRRSRDFDEKYNYILSNAGVAGLVGPLEEYDGFWCEGIEPVPESAKATPERPLRPCLPDSHPYLDLPLGERIRAEEPVETRRRLPHWQVAGSSYLITFRLMP